MLADALGLAKQQVIAEAMHRAEAGEGPLNLLGQDARLAALLDELIELLERGAINEPAPRRLTTNPAVERRERELLRGCVLDKIAEQELQASTAETAIVSAWPCSVECSRGREERRHLLTLLDNVEDATALLATDGRVLYVNEPGASILQEACRVPRDKLVGRTLDELSVPEEFGLVRARDAVVSLGRPRGRFESVIQGRVKQTVFDTVYALDGTVVAIAVVQRDIHAQTLAQNRLSLLSKLGGLMGTLDYDQVAEALASVPIPELADWCAVNIVEDRKIRQTFIAQHSPAKMHLRDALLRSLWAFGRHPLWQELLIGGFQLLSEVTDDLVRQLSVNQEQYRILAQVGIRSLMVMPVALRGQLAGIITFVYTDESGRRYDRDHPGLAEELTVHAAHIIENARLLEELRTREKRFEIALAGARTAVFEQDRSLRYRYYYDPATSATPLDKTEADVHPPEQAARLTEIKKHVLETGVSAFEEVDLNLLGSDEVRHYREAVEAQRDRAGNIVGIIGTITDITEQHRARLQLTEMVAFRERMMGLLGHDLRNPLMTISMANAGLLARTELPQDARTQVLRSQRAADRIEEMIETLLDFTRVRFLGTIPVVPVPSDLGLMARAVVEDSRMGSPDRRIELDVRGDAHGTWDPGRMAQIISNLVGNAVAHGAPDTSVSVQIDATGDPVVLSVHNEGPPIPPELLPVLFEPFRRAAGDNSPRGLGLGLYIVRQLVEAHGGTIDVRSTAQEGTTFTIELPRTPPSTRVGTSMSEAIH